MTADQIDTIKRVKKAINEACQTLTVNHESQNSRWTEVILSSICHAKPKARTFCCCSSCKDAYGEWLFDLVWYTEDNQRRLRQLSLVLESEWSHYDFEIKYDFEKLLIAKCPTKVMLTESDAALKIVRDGIKAFGQSDSSEVYMLANFKGQQFVFSLFDGKGDNIIPEGTESQVS